MSEAELGRLLYDESQMPRGIRLRQKTKRIHNAFAFFSFSVALVYTVLFATLFASMIGRNTALDIYMGLPMIGFYALGFYSSHRAVNVGHHGIYERGFVIIVPETSKVVFWPFDTIEKVILITLRKEKPGAVIVFKKEFWGRRIRSRHVVYKPWQDFADFDSFVSALEGRVPLDRIERRSVSTR